MRQNFFMAFIAAMNIVSVAKEVPKETVLSSGSTSGIFKDIVWGDYLHIIIMKDGKELDYFAGEGPISILDEFSHKLKGLKIKVSWEKVKKYIPEAGEMVEITRTTDICAYKETNFISIQKQKIPFCKD